ncbi:hypothetical protein [Nonomuraea rubra]|uniref:hypothetical protein n=1 Tax=Nonomuraea rubra TaxID=46180 RepID=UPI0036D3861F
MPRPAPVVIRRLVEGLRPQLEGSADARLVPELAEEALARGSSARRQRDAFARRGRLADVVDLLLAETRDCQWDRPADGPRPTGPRRPEEAGDVRTERRAALRRRGGGHRRRRPDGGDDA